MRDSNYHSVANNRAAVTITTSLYDRRALDVTSDKPLVNSLNHLTYLVSSSTKVRETLLNDGGLERLVEILHECHIPSLSVRDSVFSGEKKLLTAWKWTLAFQCLVLIGTRGTEKIRQKVVRAGILPVIATVLDNYINLHEGTFFGAAACAPLALAQFCANSNNYTNTSRPNVPSNFEENSRAHQLVQTHAHTSPQPRQQLNQQIQQQGQQSQQNHASNLSNRDFDEVQLNRFSEPTNTSNPPSEASGISQQVSTENMSNSFHELQSSAARFTSPTSFQDHRRFKLKESTSKQPAFSTNGGHISALASDDYETLSVHQLFKLIRESFGIALGTISSQPARSSVSNDIRRRILIMCILKKLRTEKENEVIYPYNMDDCEYDMDNSLQFLSNLYLLDEKSTHITNAIHSKIAPRNFTDSGIIVPKDDDVVWCLQLLAYISKYPYLKEILQNTHLILDMSIGGKELHSQSITAVKMRYRARGNTSARETLIPRTRTGRSFSPGVPVENDDNTDDLALVERFNPSASNSPELGNLNIRNDNCDLERDKLDICAKRNVFSTQRSTIDSISKDKSYDSRYVDFCRGEPYTSITLNVGSQYFNLNENHSRLQKISQAMSDIESITDDLDRELALFRLSDEVDACIEEECQNLSIEIIKKRLDEVEFLSDTWDYETYDKFEIDDVDMTVENDYDLSLMEYKRLNLFSAVEKFTFLAGTDMYYWSGVIMRNSCRRNEFKGGVRQCGNLECGKWEQSPREFSKCKRCKRTKYCSRDCQMRAWHCHKNWCVLSNPSTSTTNTDSVNAAYNGQHDRTMNMGAAPSDSEGIISNGGDLSQNVSASDQEAQYSEF